RSRGLVGHECGGGDAEVFAQALDAAEEEQSVLRNRTAGARPELIPFERRGIAAAVEEIARVHRAIPGEPEPRAVERVRTALRHEADDAAHRAAVVRRVGGGDEAEWLGRFDAKRGL